MSPNILRSPKILKTLFAAVLVVQPWILLSAQIEISRAARPPVTWRGVSLAGAEFSVDEEGNGAIPGVYGTDYIYPNQAEVTYYKSKGMNIIRLPFRWERLQPSLNGSFNATELTRLKTFVNRATTQDVVVILDPHNYARYRGKIVGTADLPNTAFANFWKRLATHFKGNPRVFFGLMNEPFNMPSEQWVQSANVAIKAIRQTGATQTILAPGNAWSGAWSWEMNWYGTPNAVAMKALSDPLRNTLIEVHQYMDSDSSGRSETCVSKSIGVERLKSFTQWLRTNRQQGFLGEFSAGRNQTCYDALKNMVRYVENNGDVWRGWTYWAGGPWWGDNNSIEPNGRQDKPQMNILEPFL
jgi:endoglucanase